MEMEAHRQPRKNKQNSGADKERTTQSRAKHYARLVHRSTVPTFMRPLRFFIHTRSVPSFDSVASWKPPGMMPNESPWRLEAITFNRQKHQYQGESGPISKSLGQACCIYCCTKILPSLDSLLSFLLRQEHLHTVQYSWSRSEHVKRPFKRCVAIYKKNAKNLTNLAHRTCHVM